MAIIVDVILSDDINADDDEVPEPALLQSWASASCLDCSAKKSNVKDIDLTAPGVSILISSPREIQQLNKQYREQDKATNVLSFPMQLPDDVDVQLLGDIALCAAVINEEAQQQNKPAEAHWAHMVVHGMLHLQGYDHINTNDAEEMEALETDILNTLGFGNPYE